MKSQILRCRFKILFFLILFLAIPIFLGAAVPCPAADDLYESRLDKGLFNTEPYSYLLIEEARGKDGKNKGLLDSAKRYSPDLPAVYFELARRNFSLSARGVFQSLDYFRQGIKAYGRNFWWEFTVFELLFAGLLISYVLSMLFILILRLPMDGPLLLHDGMEDKKRLGLLSIPLFLCFFGPVAFIAGVFFLLGLYFIRENKAVAYASFLFFLLSPILFGVGERFFTAQSTGLRAIVDVNAGKDNGYAIWTLKGREDFASKFSYATALKREGRYGEAIEEYKSLIGSNDKRDGLVYVNLGNSYYATGDAEAAKDSYLKAVGIAPLASAFYNLSQIHRQLLDFANGDEYFLEAAKLNPEAMSKYIARTGGSPNRFVMDENLPLSAMWEYAMEPDSDLWRGFLLSLVLAVIVIAGFYIVDRKMRYRAHRCKRCSEVFCSKCSRVVAWGEMCPECYHSLIKIDEADLKERIRRLLLVHQNRSRRRKFAQFISYIIPGSGQIYSGKILAGLLFLWPFLFSAVMLVLNLFPVMGIFPFAHDWISPIALAAMACAYIVSLLHLQRRIQKGWL